MYSFDLIYVQAWSRPYIRSFDHIYVQEWSRPYIRSFDFIYVQVDLIYLTLDLIYQILTIYLKTDFCPIWRVINNITPNHERTFRHVYPSIYCEIALPIKCIYPSSYCS